MAGTRQGPPSLTTLLRQRMALQQQVRLESASGLSICLKEHTGQLELTQQHAAARVTDCSMLCTA